jgi:hypothetical protein
MLDDGLLRTSERAVAEHFGQDGASLGDQLAFRKRLMWSESRGQGCHVP